jgi:hypothetical protein
MATIDKRGVPPGRYGTKFKVQYKARSYPPKLLISVAHEEATGVALDPILFTGGNESNGFLRRLGFVIERCDSRPVVTGELPTIWPPKLRQKLCPLQGFTSDELEDLRYQLIYVAKLYSWAELTANHLPPSKSGVYAWFFASPPCSVPVDGCIHRERRTLLYVGISPESRNSGQNLRQRIRYHFSGNAEGSTLRRTLGCLLEEELGTILRRVGSGRRMTFGPNESKLTKWMAVNAAVSWIETDCPWEIEDHLLTKLNLPLNIEANSHSPFYEALRRIRKQCCDRAKKLPVLASS